MPIKTEMLKSIFKTLKVNHYIKNLVVFIPLIFSHNFINLIFCYKCLLMFISFCLISSSVYILNDLIDIEEDEKHPVKSRRPIASGKITKPFAVLMFFILLMLSSLSAYNINVFCLISIYSYLVLNIFYSLWLKKIILIDSACIALGFIIRIIAGCCVIKVMPSALVILMTFFISNFFTGIKRRLEIQLRDYSSNLRTSMSKIDINTINQFILINAILSISFYITYVLDEQTILKTGSQYLYFTVIPFTLIVYRLLLLVNTSKIDDDPIIYLEKDKLIKILFLLYFIVYAIVVIF